MGVRDGICNEVSATTSSGKVTLLAQRVVQGHVDTQCFFAGDREHLREAGGLLQ